MRATVPALLALATTVGCAPKVFRDVPLSFASVAEPIAEVKPTEGSATVVLAYPVAPYDGGKQALTVVMDGGTLVGQVTMRSYAVVLVPPGKHTFVRGTPELDQTVACMANTATLSANKVYVFNVTGFAGVLPVIPGVEKALSKITFLEVDAAAGKAKVEQQREFWKKCTDYAVAHEAEWRPFADKEVSEQGASPGADFGVDRIAIPAPP